MYATVHPVPQDQTIGTIAGLPITGRIVTVDPAPPRQRNLADLERLIRDTIADDEQIAELGWLQHSPYLGDGVWGRFWADWPWVRTIHDQPDPDSPDHEPDIWAIEVNHPSIGTSRATYDAERWARCEAFAKALRSREYNDALLAAFGDCAAVSITPGRGVTVREHIEELGF